MQNYCIRISFSILFLALTFDDEVLANAIEKQLKLLELTKRSNISIEELVKNPNCLVQKDRGHECLESESEKDSRGMKWYFDAESLRCLAFGYKGCGGNANRFDTMADCHKNCELTLPADYAHCAGGEAATARKANGRQIICFHSNRSLVEECPKGYRCQMLFAYGVCCDSRTYEVYAHNYHPKCPNSTEPLKILDKFNQIQLEVLGKSCEDEFCPEQMECHQLELFAHCCPKRRH